MNLVLQHPGITDKEMTSVVYGEGAAPQRINQECRRLEECGKLTRCKRPDGLIGNYLSDPHVSPTQEISAKTDSKSSLSEDAIKSVLEKWLLADDWTVKTAMGKAHGIDVEANKPGERWIIEVKGPGSRDPMRVNYFISILGETLQRMNDPNARYSICFPRLQQYERLWAKLPQLAKKRTGISIIFVSPDGSVEELRS